VSCLTETGRKRNTPQSPTSQNSLARIGRPNRHTESLHTVSAERRHSFTLKRFSVLSLAWEQRLDGFTAGEAADMRDMFGDVWFQLATLMGHADPSTTRETYRNSRVLHQPGEKSQVSRSPKGRDSVPCLRTSAV
jgi:hypothetical protein